MSNNLRSVRGMRDLFNSDACLFEYICNSCKKISILYGYESVITPIVEYSEVFMRTLGDSSDVIAKEMYSFNDRSNNSISMRPEFTAGIMRAFISNSKQHELPLKLYSSGPLFRYDRPQAGRQRQFNQINAEYIGANLPLHDAELISMAYHMLSALGLQELVQLEINSIGSTESRKKYEKALVIYLQNYINSLSEDSQKRLLTNPLRILDSKDNKDQEILDDGPKINDFLSFEDQDFFSKILENLASLNIPFIVNNKLVRGLDYYTHTVFEFTTQALGAQSTLLAGGRYDGLCKKMGGLDVPAIGFAGGVERLMLMRQYQIQKQQYCYILPTSKEDAIVQVGFELASALRMANIPIIFLSHGKLQKNMQNAMTSGANFLIFIGPEEVASGKYQLKDLEKSHQQELDLQSLVKFLQEKFA